MELPFDDLRCPYCQSNYYAFSRSILNRQTFNYMIPDTYRQLFEFFLLCQTSDDSLSILPNEILWLIVELLISKTDQMQVYCQCRAVSLTDLYHICFSVNSVKVPALGFDAFPAFSYSNCMSSKTRQLFGCDHLHSISERNKIILTWSNQEKVFILLYKQIIKTDQGTHQFNRIKLPELTESQLYQVFIHMQFSNEQVYFDDVAVNDWFETLDKQNKDELTYINVG